MFCPQIDSLEPSLNSIMVVLQFADKYFYFLRRLFATICDTDLKINICSLSRTHCKLPEEEILQKMLRPELSETKDRQY